MVLPTLSKNRVKEINFGDICRIYNTYAQYFEDCRIYNTYVQYFNGGEITDFCKTAEDVPNQ